jgi:hypothetical protein
VKTPRYPKRRGLAILGAVLLLVSAFPRQSYAVFGFGDSRASLMQRRWVGGGGAAGTLYSR